MLQIAGNDPDRLAAILAEIQSLTSERSVLPRPGDQLRARGVRRRAAGTDEFPSQRPAALGRDQIVLPDDSARERRTTSVPGSAGIPGRLLACGQHLKRGVLLYGAAGYRQDAHRALPSQPVAGPTVMVISGGRSAGSAPPAGRPHAPALRRRAGGRRPDRRDREGHPGEQPLLFELLNEIDGLGSARRCHVPAHHQPGRPARARAGRAPGAGRPAAELPAAGRHREPPLIELCPRRGGLVLDHYPEEDALIERTEGVTAAFLKELLRKAALLSCEEDEAPGPRARYPGDRPRTWPPRSTSSWTTATSSPACSSAGAGRRRTLIRATRPRRARRRTGCATGGEENASLLPSLNWTALNSSLSGSCSGIGQRFAQFGPEHADLLVVGSR